MRRSEFPSVVPYPLSNGSATNLPNVASSLISTTSMLGFSISIIFVKPSFKTTVFLLRMKRDLCFTFAIFLLFIKVWQHQTLIRFVTQIQLMKCIICTCYQLFNNQYTQVDKL